MSFIGRLLNKPKERSFAHALYAMYYKSVGLLDPCVAHTVATESLVVVRILAACFDGTLSSGESLRFLVEHVPHFVAGVIGQTVAVAAGVPKEYAPVAACAADLVYSTAHSVYQELSTPRPA